MRRCGECGRLQPRSSSSQFEQAVACRVTFDTERVTPRRRILELILIN